MYESDKTKPTARTYRIEEERKGGLKKTNKNILWIDKKRIGIDKNMIGT